MLAKNAKKHNIENYKKFVTHLGKDNYDDKFVTPISIKSPVLEGVAPMILSNLTE